MTHPDQLQALEKVRDALQLSLDEADGCELNMSNYHHDNVGDLNSAYVRLFQGIEQALALLPDLIASAKDGGWLPIETAPQDYNRYLFLQRNGVMAVDRYYAEKQSTTGRRWNEGGAKEHLYTHWKLLPNLPESLKK